MTPETTETQENERNQRARKLLILLVACVLVMSSLLCCGQVALLLATSNRTVDTLSLLQADYSPWGYGKVGVINVSGYKEDLQNDQEQEGVVVVVPGDDVEPGVFWPTGIPTPMPVAAVTETASLTPVELIPTLTATITETVAPSITPTSTISGGMPQGTATRTPTRTHTAVVATLSPTPSPTRTFTYVPQPTRTHTQAPVEPSNTPVPPTHTPTLTAVTASRTPTRVLTTPAATSTRTPTRTNTVPVVIATRTPTRTNTVPPTRTFTPTITVPVVIPTFTFTPTHTPTTPVPPTFTFTPTTVVTTPPVYLVFPKAENGGFSDPDPEFPETDCHGYFGYINTNPGTVIFPPGGSNYLSTDAYEVFTGDPDYIDGLPSNFYTGEWSGILHVRWNTGVPITWTINGQSATLAWCH